MVKPSPASSLPDAAAAAPVSPVSSAAPAVMNDGNRVPPVNRSTIPPSWSTATVTGNRRPAAFADRCRARLAFLICAALVMLSLNTTTPPRCSPLTSFVGAAVPL